MPMSFHFLSRKKLQWDTDFLVGWELPIFLREKNVVYPLLNQCRFNNLQLTQFLHKLGINSQFRKGEESDERLLPADAKGCIHTGREE